MVPLEKKIKCRGEIECVLKFETEFVGTVSIEYEKSETLHLLSINQSPIISKRRTKFHDTHYMILPESLLDLYSLSHLSK